ncbi:hypothetical protein ACED63_06960 [Vibrio splendidus]|uniref:hypothetical protein n=1 Tax=Vibrio splendidus TaxID=29497 RepID=UPI00352CF9E8
MRKFLFILGHMIWRPSVIFYYYKFKISGWDAETSLHEELYKINKKSDIKRTKYEYDNLKVSTKSDLQKKDISGVKGVPGRTGGSTGQPLRYFMNKGYYSKGFSLLYLGWSYAGYNLGDKVGVLAGGSLIGKDLSFSQKVKDFILNFRHYSSYGMNEQTLESYYQDMLKHDIKFLRGYASSIYELCLFIKRRNLDKLNLTAVFTTSEKLTDNTRNLIESVLSVPVYDQYGLNDGGVSAFECKYHTGMHVFEGRAHMAVVDDTGKQVYDESGLIVATSFNNDIYPFVKYNTGDNGTLNLIKCECGFEGKNLISVDGRTTDVLNLNGSIIGSPVLTVLMSSVPVIKYQVIQLSEDTVKFIIEKDGSYTSVDELFIINSIKSNCGEDAIVIFDYDCNFIVSKNGKHKFIIRS